ncbi:MAG: hypothetical protein BWY32_00246 [bacterium ADurb.Bin243]|mgnify:CR=1 FL=1|nr:MAG: hypothetical protein BWY32_00246 [bacterium ADurb.Bin243]
MYNMKNAAIYAVILICVFTAARFFLAADKISPITGPLIIDEGEKTKEVAIKSSSPASSAAPAGGHRNVSVDETEISKAETGFLPFATMQLWNFDPEKNNHAPDFIMSVDKKELKILGFMYPLEEGEEIKNFCLLKSTQTCCYGPKPQYNQYVLVEMDKKVKFERLRPVVVSGRFFVDPKPADGYIYRMDGRTLEPFGEDNFVHDAGTEVESSSIEELDIALVEKFIKTIDGKNSSDLTENDYKFFEKYEGKIFKVKGFLTGILSKKQKNILIGKYYWDGCCTGIPPSLMNSIPVKLKSGERIPQFWDNELSFAGRVKINRDAVKWVYNGIMSLEDSVRLKR